MSETDPAPESAANNDAGQAEAAEPPPSCQELSDRIVELQILSAEQAEAILRLEAFISGYEQRVRLLEKEVVRLNSSEPEGAEPLPPALEDVPPHY